MIDKKQIALVAHDTKKKNMETWVKKHVEVLNNLNIWATGNTGEIISNATGLNVTRLLSGPLGGDQQLGAMIAEGKIDILVFFIDPLSSLPHDVDVKALLRISILYQIAFACNEQTANHLLNSFFSNEPPDNNKELSA